MFRTANRGKIDVVLSTNIQDCHIFICLIDLGVDFDVERAQSFSYTSNTG